MSYPFGSPPSTPAAKSVRSSKPKHKNAKPKNQKPKLTQAARFYTAPIHSDSKNNPTTHKPTAALKNIGEVDDSQFVTRVQHRLQTNNQANTSQNQDSHDQGTT